MSSASQVTIEETVWITKDLWDTVTTCHCTILDWSCSKQTSFRQLKKPEHELGIKMISKNHTVLLRMILLSLKKEVIVEWQISGNTLTSELKGEKRELQRKKIKTVGAKNFEFTIKN